MRDQCTLFHEYLRRRTICNVTYENRETTKNQDSNIPRIDSYSIPYDTKHLISFNFLWLLLAYIALFICSLVMMFVLVLTQKM